MINTKTIGIMLAMAVFLSSCDLLGIGSDNDPKGSAPALVWKKEHTGSTSGALPIIDKGSVYLPGFELTKVDLETGSTAWKVPLDYDGNTPDDYSSRMLLSEEAVIIDQPTTTKAFQKSDGQLLWETDTDIAPDQEEAAPRLMVQVHDYVFVGQQQKIVGLAKNTGTPEIDIALTTLIPDAEGHQVIALAAESDTDPLLFAATGYGLSPGGYLLAVRPGDGSSVWITDANEIKESTTSSTIKDLALVNNLLIVLTAKEITAFEPDTGNRVWQTALEESGSQLLGAENALFVSTFSGTVWRLNSKDGTVEWQSSTGEDLFSISTGPMTWDDGYLYYPEFKDGLFNMRIRIIETDGGTTARVIKASDISNVGVDFSMLGGVAVQQPYLIKQGAANTYGIKLQDD